MDKIVVPTKFNKSGKRVLTVPLDDEKVCAPAYRLYRNAYRVAQAEWKCKWDCAKHAYVERMAHWIASYVAKDSTPTAEKYKIAKSLAEQTLRPINVEAPGPSGRWSNQLGGLPELAKVEQEIWETYTETCRKADAEKETTLYEARLECSHMKRALSREIIDHIHRQHHPDDANQNR